MAATQDQVLGLPHAAAIRRLLATDSRHRRRNHDSRIFGASFGGTTRGGHHAFDCIALSLMTPSNWRRRRAELTSRDRRRGTWRTERSSDLGFIGRQAQPALLKFQLCCLGGLSRHQCSNWVVRKQLRCRLLVPLILLLTLLLVLLESHQ